MSSDLYALVALAARYWFAALMLVLLFRGWRMTVADNRRAKLLREWMGQTGCVGELIANPGARNRVSYPIPREGVLGSGRSADVRIRHRDLRRAHAHFELREGGLLIRPLGSARLAVGGGHSGEAVFLENGDVLNVGRLALMLVLFDAPVEAEADEWFEVASGDAAGAARAADVGDGLYGDAFGSAPEPRARSAAGRAAAESGAPAKARAPRKAGARRGAKAAPVSLPFSQANGADPIDDFFDEDELWRDR